MVNDHEIVESTIYLNQVKDENVQTITLPPPLKKATTIIHNDNSSDDEDEVTNYDIEQLTSVSHV